MEQSNKKVVLDSSMLLNIEDLKIDVFDELKKEFGKVDFYITNAIDAELKLLTEKNQKTRKKVKIAKKLMEKNKVKVLYIDTENADDSLVEAGKKGMYVASNDKELRKRIKKVKGKNIYLRKKTFIEITQ